MLLSSSQSITQSLDALTVVVQRYQPINEGQI